MFCKKSASYKEIQKALMEPWVQDVGRGIAGQSQTKPAVFLLKLELQGLFMRRWGDGLLYSHG